MKFHNRKRPFSELASSASGSTCEIETAKRQGKQLDQEALLNGKKDTAITKILATRRELFWDKASLHPDRDKYVIVERILEFGTEEEAAAVICFYGNEFIKEVIRESPNLSPKTVNYFAMIFNIPRENSRCFSDASRRIWQPF